MFVVCVCVGVQVCVWFLTQQVLHALGRLDDLGADRRAADAVQGVVGLGDDLNEERQKPALCHTCYFCSSSTLVSISSAAEWTLCFNMYRWKIEMFSTTTQVHKA